MLIHPLPIGMFLKSLLSAAESCGYLGAVVLLARTRDAKAQHRELTEDWTSVHDLTGPALAVLCPLPPHAWPGGVRHPTEPAAVSAEGMTLEVPYMRERFDKKFWDDLGPGWDKALTKPERPAPAEVHASGWTQAVTDAAEFFGIEESHVPCMVLLSMREKHGTVIPIDESFGIYEFLKKLMEHVGLAPVRLGRALDERKRLQRQVGRYGLAPTQVRSLNRKLAKAEALAPELIADCRARVETLTRTEPSDPDLRVLREVSDLLRSPRRQAERHNLRIRGLLGQLERVIGTLETQRPAWEESRRSREALATVEREVRVLRSEVAAISLSSLIPRVAAELHEEGMAPTSRLPGWSFSRLGRRPRTDEGRPDSLPGASTAGETVAPVAVILTALSVEYQAVRAHLTDVETVVHPSGTRAERGRLAGTSGYVALAEIGEGTLTAAALTERFHTWLHPQALLFVGVAGGLKDDIEVGDVVVATKVYGIHGGKQTPEGFLVRPEAWRTSHRLEQAARHALRGRARFKPIAVGDIVLADAASAVARHLHEHYNDAVAIEMEGTGVAQAAHLTGELDTLIIRGISDRADTHKHERDAEGSQPKAARNAAQAAFAVLQELSAADPAAGPLPQRSVKGP
ncbi:hypothetical protein [Streptomyces sp. NPDC093094]|uniref:5'-methylthioadenosine/S-adenosylhomocysteine nucleosidase n=1 Tax=Streptomyces sp. NPDC093094 TaxID=3366026 RepID=UPI003806E248